jgi:hypothetical protein
VTEYSVPTNSTPGYGSDGVEFKDVYIPFLGFQREQTLVMNSQLITSSMGIVSFGMQLASDTQQKYIYKYTY